MKFLPVSILVSLLVGSFLLSTASGSSDAELKKIDAVVNENVSKTLSILRNKKINKQEKRDQVNAIIDPLFHFELIAKLSLGKKHWGQFSKEQQSQFTVLFIEQLKESYFDKMDLLTDETVRFQGSAWKGKKIHSSTEILSKDKRFQVIFKFYKRKGKWLVYDVEIEGISIVKSFNLQYDQFLRKKSIPELLQRMKDKNLDSAEKIQEEVAKKKAKGGKS